MEFSYEYKYMKICVTLLVGFGVLLLIRMGSAETQSELNAEARTDFTVAEKQLDLSYHKLFEILDQSGQQKLAAAQKAWIAYREAESALEADQVRGGTAELSILNATRAELTRQQIERLKKILPRK